MFGLVVVLTQHTTLPWYGYIASLLLGTVVAPFSGILYALLGNGISTNNLTKMVGGLIVPGRPLANLYFYAWSHSTIAQVINLSNDLKLGQYLKIPPRSMFIGQSLGTAIGGVVNYAFITVRSESCRADARRRSSTASDPISMEQRLTRLANGQAAVLPSSTAPRSSGA